jgi:hypothetical protein
MTLLTVIRDVCAAVGVTLPSSIFTNITGNRTMQEMVSLANETAQSIAYDTRDWTRLKKTQTYVGDGVTTAFDMPADYKRMLLNSNVWRSTSTVQPMTFIPDTDEWMNRRVSLADDNSWGEWTLLGGQMHIFPAMGVGTTAYFSYLNKNCISLASSGYGDSFLADSDAFTLDERVFKLGMIWKWKANKGGAYAEDMGTYGDALAKVSGADSPGPIIIGRRVLSANTRVAYPFSLPNPP